MLGTDLSRNRRIPTPALCQPSDVSVMEFLRAPSSLAVRRTAPVSSIDKTAIRIKWDSVHDTLLGTVQRTMTNVTYQHKAERAGFSIICRAV